MTATKPEAKQSIAYFSSANFSAGISPNFERKTNEAGADVLLVTDMPIFRSGEFRDSMGYEHEYDGFHMDQMVANFGMLQGKSIMENLPVRAGHYSPFSNSMATLIGSVLSLRTESATSPSDGETYTYLLATFEVWDGPAADHIEKKHWVNRSAEIGMYETNSGMAFYPTLMGFAYVDIPAVEGLNFSRLSGFNKDFVVACDGEIKEEALMGAPNPGAPFEFSLKTGETTDFAAVQQHIAAIEGENETLTASNAALTTEVEGLREFEREQMKAGRESFVDSLITDNKVLAGQKEALYGFVGTLSDSQFQAYKASFASAPQHPVLSPQDTSSQASGTPASTEPVKDEVFAHSGPRSDDPLVAQAQVQFERHVLSGIMDVEKAKNTASGKLLVSKGLV